MPISRVNQLPSCSEYGSRQRIASDAYGGKPRSNRGRSKSVTRKSRKDDLDTGITETKSQVPVSQTYKQNMESPMYSHLSQKCIDLETENGKLRESMKSLQANMSKLTKEHHEEVNKVTKQMTAKTSSDNSLEKLRSKHKKETEDLHERISELSKEHANVSQKLSAKNAFCNELHMRVNEMAEKLEKHESMRDAVEHAMEMHKLCVDTLKSRCMHKIASEIENGIELLKQTIS